jgi:hypothetical protein
MHNIDITDQIALQLGKLMIANMSANAQIEALQAALEGRLPPVAPTPPGQPEPYEDG